MARSEATSTKKEIAAAQYKNFCFYAYSPKKKTKKTQSNNMQVTGQMPPGFLVLTACMGNTTYLENRALWWVPEGAMCA